MQARVAAFVDKHPEVTIPKWMGGMSYTEAGERLGIHPSTVASTMRKLGYQKSLIVQTKEEREAGAAENQRRRLSDPVRRAAHTARCAVWQKAHPEKKREIDARALHKWKTTVLRQESCVVCGKEFGWTKMHEQSAKVRRVGCSFACSRRANAAARPSRSGSGRRLIFDGHSH